LQRRGSFPTRHNRLHFFLPVTVGAFSLEFVFCFFFFFFFFFFLKHQSKTFPSPSSIYSETWAQISFSSVVTATDAAQGRKEGRKKGRKEERKGGSQLGE
jgi:hypothetical protein